jgi:hypothetical protein
VVGVKRATQVVAGEGLSCALTKTGVWCWGTGSPYAEGKPAAARPAPVKALEGARRLSIWEKTLCGYSASGVQRCANLPAGNREDDRLAIPQAARDAQTVLLDQVGNGFALLRDGSVVFLYRDLYRVPGIEDAIDIAGDRDSACVVRRTGRVSCVTATGMMNIRPLKPRFQVRDVDGIERAALIRSGNGDFAVLTRPGKTITFHPGPWPRRPREEPLLNDATDFAIGVSFKCALRRSRHVVCAGDNDRGQLGSGDFEPSKTVLQPDVLFPEVIDEEWKPVVGLANVVSIAAGGSHACAALASGRVLCWGSNDSQELGYGPQPFTITPVEVKGLELMTEPPSPR